MINKKQKKDDKSGTALRMRRIGTIIDTQKSRLRYTQVELSRQTGLTDQTIINIRNGENTYVKNLLDICEILELDMKLVDRTTGEEHLI
ncbi:MAG: helix-turn-helix domain-containing protein [Bacteroidetes bacterium]|uniref:Helix-turn-helix domain-containing protein n=1 Tax=Candidatus Merdivivens pullicola TaxID=2840872 RepID=A0A9D9IHY0_9BACT|nr:helix-turn-helix domain-containing protein [Candidatus Merdivivens pullicola]